MPNPYETAAREKKVTRLIDALDAELGRRCCESDLNCFASPQNANPDFWGRIFGRARVQGASDKTVARLVERIHERDKMHAEEASR